MTVFTDHKRTVSIELRNWDGSQYGPDFSADFYDLASLTHSDGVDGRIYEVDDIDYLIDYANDMIHGAGDFAGTPSPNTTLSVTDVERS